MHTLLRVHILRNTVKIHFHRQCRSSRFSVVSAANNPNPPPPPPRTYQVVVAATRDMGIGKQGKLPWKLPSDLKFFKDITTTTSDPTKKNAVIMGRKTWESVPLQFRPLPARLNVVLTRSGLGLLDNESSGNVVVFGSIRSALVSLASPPYCQSIEKVFVIGGGEILRETLNAPKCEAIHITEIETSVDCDTFIPTIDLSLFRPWCSSQPLIENNVRFRFSTYVRANSDEFGLNSFDFLPRIVFGKHEENSYLNLLREIISSVSNNNGEFEYRTSCELQFSLRKSFPLLTTKRVSWDVVIEQLFSFTGGFSKAKLSDVIDKIKNYQNNNPIILSTQNPSDLKLEFCVANGELLCQTYQRFADVSLTSPTSIASCALLTNIIANLCGLVAGSITYKLGEAHVNRANISTLQEQIKKLPKPFPILKINTMKMEIDSLVAEDFELIGYEPHP